MIRPDTEVLLRSGEALTAAEVFEGLILLSRETSSFPLMSERDHTQALIETAFDAADWAKENEV